MIASLGFALNPPDAVMPLFIPCRADPKIRHRMDGYGGMRTSFAFLLWAQAQRNLPTPLQVQDAFACSKATAYRWIAGLREAYGLPALRERNE